MVLQTGCGDASQSKQLADARVSVEKKDDKAAVIQLKSVLQNSPDSAEARLLLGTVLLRRGDASGAAVELGRAVESKQFELVALPLLAEALLASREPKKVIELDRTRTPADPKVGAELKAMVGMAHLLLGQRDASTAAVKAALVLDPKSVSARLMQARALGELGEVDQALTILESVLTDNPGRVDAWQLKGDLLWRGKSQPDSAKAAFEQVLQIDSAYVPAHSALLSLLLQKPDVAGFKRQLEVLRKASPNHPDTKFFEVQLALIDKNLPLARDGAQKLLRMAPDSPLILQLAGSVEYESGSLNLAEIHLNKALKLSPKLPLATRLLADTHLRSGNAERALALLLPLIDLPAAGAGELALAAQAYMQLGNLAKAEAYFARAAKSNPADPRPSVALALAQLMKGNAEAGFSQLEALAASDKTTYADLALISARLQRSDSAAALKALERLQVKEPDKPLPHLIRGRIALLRKDVTAARASFEQALLKDPVYFPAVEDLANLDVLQKQPGAARKRYELLLSRQPGNYRALLAVAQLRQAAGDSAEQIDALLVDAVKLNRTELATHVRLIEYRLAQRRAKAAAEAAQAGLTVAPDNPQLLDLLGQAQIGSGDVQQAIQTFGKVVKLLPNVGGPLLRLANAHMTRQEYPLASQYFRRALAVAPDLIPAYQGLVLIALSTKKPDEALSVVRALQKQRPKEPVGYLMEAEVHMGQRNWDLAIASMRNALQRGRATPTAMRLHALYLKAGRAADADRFAEAWLRDQPKDAEFMFHLAALAMERKDYPRAELLSRQILGAKPEHAVTLNNLAWLLVQQGKPGAVAVAERANTLLPNQPMLLDTLASALAAEKQYSQALVHQQRAVSLDPNIPQYRLGLAKLLIASGDRNSARAELDKLSSLGGGFGNQAEVASLLKGL